MKIHTVIDYVEMRMSGFKMTHDKVLFVLESHSVQIFFGELCHEFIGKTGSVGIVKTDGDMSRRILLAGHKSVYRLKGLHHSGVVGYENLIVSDDAPCVGRVFFRVVKLSCHVPHDIVKRAAFKDSCKHSLSPCWVLIF
jgi:hypothetical protein